MVQMDALTFEAAEEIFSNGVVERIAFAGHALTDFEVSKTLTVSKAAYWTPRSE